MKKILIISFIVLVAVLNFTLVKSKKGDVTLKSITELAQANADEITHPCQIRTIYLNEDVPWVYHYEYKECNNCSKNTSHVPYRIDTEVKDRLQSTEYCWDFYKQDYFPSGRVTYYDMFHPFYSETRVGVCQLCGKY